MTKETILKALHEVKDPEIPAISVVDLGIITGIEVSPNESAVEIQMTPTFVGCPAIALMQREIREKVESLGFKKVAVTIDEKKKWSSNLISKKGRQQLKNFGLAPPPQHTSLVQIEMLAHVTCPFCDSSNTRLNSPFGSALCRAIHYCNSCKQTFEQFKPL